MFYSLVFSRTVPSVWSHWGVLLDTKVQGWALFPGQSQSGDLHSVDISTTSSVWWPCIIMATRTAGGSHTESSPLCFLSSSNRIVWFYFLPSLQCPTCKTIYGVKTGNQPAGKMEYHVIPHSLPGHPDCKTIRIIYNIPPGIQVPEKNWTGKSGAGFSSVVLHKNDQHH